MRWSSSRVAFDKVTRKSSPLQRVVDIFDQMRALDEAHEQGIVHRGSRQENVILVKSWGG